MGVYFPNMKKPPTCSECPVKLDCGLYWDIPEGGIDSNCPVIYIKSPHEKLIDIKDVKSKKFHIEGRAEMYLAYNIGWNDALDSVCMNAHSIIPVEGGKIE